MKKILSVIILCALLIGVVTSFSSCGAMTMDDVEEALERLERRDKIEYYVNNSYRECDPEGWTEEINEEDEKDLQGEILTVFLAEDDDEKVFIFEFESTSDAKLGQSILSDFEGKSSTVRRGKIVFWSEDKDSKLLDLILKEI